MSRLLDALKNLQQQPETAGPDRKIVPRLAGSIRRALGGSEPASAQPAAPPVLFRMPIAGLADEAPVSAETAVSHVSVVESYSPAELVNHPSLEVPRPVNTVDVRTPDPAWLIDSISDSIVQSQQECARSTPATAPVAPTTMKPVGKALPEVTAGEREILAVLGDSARCAPYQNLIGAVARDTAASRLPIISILGIDERDATSFVAATLATLIAEQRECKVLLIEANARSGQISDRYGLGDPLGLSELLAGRADESRVLLPTSHRNLDIVPFGQANAAQSKLLPAVLKDELALLRSHYGSTVIDGGPLASDWALAASQSADAAYVLVRLNETSAEEATRQVARFRAAGGKLTGCIAVGSAD